MKKVFKPAMIKAINTIEKYDSVVKMFPWMVSAPILRYQVRDK